MHTRLAKTLHLALAVVLVLMVMPVAMPAALSSQAIEQPSVGIPSHYIVFLQRSDGSILPLYHRSVTVRGLESLSDTQLANFLAEPGRDRQRMVAKVRSVGGQTVFQSLVEIPQWLRGEFAAEDSVSIDGHFFDLDEPVFVVRVPIVQGATLVLTPSGGDGHPESTEFDLDRLAAVTPSIDPEALQAVHETDSPEADPANRVDLLIMGDGYTAAQQSDFETAAQLIGDEFLDISPLAEYANYVTVHTLFTPSNEAGADHPPYSSSCSYYDPTCCGDPAMLSDPLQGTMVDTAFDSRYCANNIHRLLVPNPSKVYAAAGALPDWDQIILLVNDTTYGGSGGAFSTISMHSAAVEIARHEYGHSFAGLADEYDSAYPGFPSCSDIDGPACEPNVTDVVDRAQIKWSPWIEPTTPVPTPEDPAWDGYVGLFEGARYLSTGMYRPGLFCIMRVLGTPFCQVPSQTYVLKLYDGGWGVPSGGISLIEPGTAVPISPLTLLHPAEQTFGAEILQPIGGPPVEITWLVNDVPVPGENEAQFTYSTQGDQLGEVEINLQVRDVTPLVHPEMAGDSLLSTYTWFVEVTGEESTLTISDASANESDGTMVFDVTLSPSSDFNVWVDYATSDGPSGPGGATEGADYTLTEGTLEILAGSTHGQIEVPILPDDLYEGDEVFTVALDNPVNASVVDAVGQGTIYDEEGPPEVSFGETEYAVDEDVAGGLASITVTLTGDSALTTTVDYEASDGSAGSADYTAVSGTLTFAPEVTIQTFAVPILDDALDEFDQETVLLALDNANNAELGLDSATLTIQDDDLPPEISVGDVSTAEGDRTMHFPVSLSAPSGLDIQVGYTTSSGAGLSSASPGIDYYATSGTLTILAGASTASVDVDIRSDLLYELDETFYVTLSEPVNVTLSDAEATGTILNNDDPPEIEFETDLYTVGEGGATVILTVTISGPTALAATVNYATEDGPLPTSAKAGEDYSLSTGTIELPPGDGSQTIIVDILDDALPEVTETFEVVLSGATYSDLGSLSSTVVKIIDDDAYRVYLPLIVRDVAP